MTMVHERKQQDRQERRRRIQEAAREVFAERGYAKTSIEQIARHASLSVGAIYLYFRSKEDLYVSLMEEPLERFEQDLTELRNSQHDLAAAWRYLVDWARENVEGTRMLRLISQIGIRKQLSEDVARTVADGVRRIQAHLQALIENGIESGIYHPVDAASTAWVLWSLYLGTLELMDAQTNLVLGGPSFDLTADAAFSAIENGLRMSRSQVAEAA